MVLWIGGWRGWGIAAGLVTPAKLKYAADFISHEIFCWRMCSVVDMFASSKANRIYCIQNL
jgi:hypothetical protein